MSNSEPVSVKLPDAAPVPPTILETVGSLFDSHGAKVLGVMGLIIGYICFFFVKILNFTDMYIGVIGISVTTLMLLFLDQRRQLNSLNWWIRAITVIIVSLFLTSPQIYYAWTVSVNEKKDAAEAKRTREAVELASQRVPQTITIKTQRDLQ